MWYQASLPIFIIPLCLSVSTRAFLTLLSVRNFIKHLTFTNNPLYTHCLDLTQLTSCASSRSCFLYISLSCTKFPSTPKFSQISLIFHSKKKKKCLQAKGLHKLLCFMQGLHLSMCCTLYLQLCLYHGLCCAFFLQLLLHLTKLCLHSGSPFCCDCWVIDFEYSLLLLLSRGSVSFLRCLFVLNIYIYIYYMRYLVGPLLV